MKCHIKKGDTVVAIAGDDKGKTGKVLQLIPGKGTAIVEGLNFIKKHVRATSETQQGGIVEKEAPMHVSNLKKQEA
jgi:large subunit ribosomal protein L24